MQFLTIINQGYTEFILFFYFLNSIKLISITMTEKMNIVLVTRRLKIEIH
jgi:hypothetical protein